MQTLLFFCFSVLAYVGISAFGQLSGGAATSLLSAAGNALRPLPLLVLVAANVFFAMAVFSGLSWTRFAIPAALAVGVVTSFAYSAFFLGGAVTLVKVAGILLILVGIYLLR